MISEIRFAITRRVIEYIDFLSAQDDRLRGDELVGLLNIDRPRWSKITNGQYAVTLDIAYQVCEKLGASASFILQGRGPMREKDAKDQKALEKRIFKMIQNMDNKVGALEQIMNELNKDKIVTRIVTKRGKKVKN